MGLDGGKKGEKSVGLYRGVCIRRPRRRQEDKGWVRARELSKKTVWRRRVLRWEPSIFFVVVVVVGGGSASGARRGENGKGTAGGRALVDGEVKGGGECPLVNTCHQSCFIGTVWDVPMRPPPRFRRTRAAPEAHHHRRHRHYHRFRHHRPSRHRWQMSGAPPQPPPPP